ncbi:MAG: hypothetical protein EB108_07400, partial [Actinobacteria bacterium]|nr:hypothetical protein [Actinomycetota bacterium]
FVDLSRNCRYGDDVRTEILGSQGAIFVDLLPTGRTRLATKDGVIEVSGSQVIDATAAGIESQLDAFVQAIKVGGTGAVPSGYDSARSTNIGHAVISAAKSGEKVFV